MVYIESRGLFYIESWGMVDIETRGVVYIESSEWLHRVQGTVLIEFRGLTGIYI